MGAKNQPAVGPGPTGRERKRLTGQGHPLKAKVRVGRSGATDAVLKEIRRALTHVELLKVRIDADSPAEADVLAGDIASRVPCHLIQRVGRIALLYRPARQDSDQAGQKGEER